MWKGFKALMPSVVINKPDELRAEVGNPVKVLMRPDARVVRGTLEEAGVYDFTLVFRDTGERRKMTYNEVLEVHRVN